MAELLLPNYATVSSFNLTQAMDRVRGDLGLRNSPFLLDDDITGWLNEGNTELASQTGFFSLITLTDSVSGQQEYALPTSSLRIDNVFFSNLWMEPITIDELNTISWNWQSAMGTPYFWYARGTNALGLYPKPNMTSGGIIRVEYTALPTEVTEPEEHFICVQAEQRLILVYAKMMASEKDINGEGEKRWPIYKRQWDEGVQAVKSIVEGFQMGQIWSAGGYGNYNRISEPLYSFDQGIPVVGAGI
jgi:hypothetical protein